MRIVIDMQAYQSGTAHAPLATLTLAQALARSAGEHTVLLLLHSRFDATLGALRLAFASLLPASHIHVFDAPPDDGGWSRLAGALLRETMLADLGADLVLVPGLFDGPGAHIVCSPDSTIPAAYLCAAVPVLEPAMRSGAEEEHLQRQQLLRQAALLAAPSEELCAQLAELSPAAPVVCLDGDAAAAAAQLWPALVQAAHQATAAPPAPARPRLAYLSPLPPQKSGIADYSVELLAQLEQYYDIDLILVDGEPCEPALAQRYTVRTVEWFEQHAGEFARRLYHIGNNSLHQHMFELLRRQPGVVVLHDFFLSGALDNMERDGYLPQAFMATLYESHGYGALMDHQRQGRNPTIWQYPCNKGVIDNAAGVIVHSAFSRQLARQWYGPDAAADWQTLPMIRGLPDGHDAGAARRAARRELGVQDDEFLICSFGMMGVTKLNERLLAAFVGSDLAQDAKCRLVFVGEGDHGQYGRALERTIGDSPAGGRVTITGFVTPQAYASYLAAADVAVQLRSQTRGETSASVLDCLLHGVSTVINAHGSSAALSDDLLVKLADDCSAQDLAQALLALRRDPARRQELGARAAAFMAREHAPAHVGRAFFDAIEHFARHSPASHYGALLQALARLPKVGDTQLGNTAAAIVANRLPVAPRQLFVDISALVQTDLKTGIQRVVRSILLALIETPPAGYRIEPVYSDGGNRPYRYARNFMLAMLGVPNLLLEDAPLDVRAGDMFLGLDLFTNGTAQNRQRLQSMHDHGVQIYFVVYDLLPVLLPDAFPAGAERYFAEYLDTVAAVADGAICISRAVADELHDWLAQRPQRRAAPLQLGWFHLGADIDASAPTSGLPPDAGQVLAAVAARQSLLMVGTVEPRKGQGQALDAFELLWQRGVDASLVIVGKQGWMMETLAKRLQNHPEQGHRLFWLNGVSDEMLVELYDKCSALLAASVGEGFGLPLIEAAQRGLPIIARDIPVFREVGGEHAYYFNGATADDLADTLQQWLALHGAGQAPPSASLPWLTWRHSADQLTETVAGQRWYRTLAGIPPAAGVN